MPKQKLSMKTFLFVFLSVFLFFLAPVSVKAFPGICWSSETFVNQGAENLFDGSYLSKWHTIKAGSSYYHVVFDQRFAPSRIASYTMTTAGDASSHPKQNPINWALYGSNITSHYWSSEQDKWDLIDIRRNCHTLKAQNYTAYTFNLKKPVNAYKYYFLRIEFEDDEDSYATQLAELTFYDHVHTFKNSICTRCGCQIGKLADDYGNKLPPQKDSKPISLKRPVISSLVRSGKQIQLKWNRISNASGYQIFRKTDSGNFSLVATVTGKSQINFYDTTIRTGHKYTYKIRAFAKQNSYTYYSSFSQNRQISLPKGKQNLSSLTISLGYSCHKYSGKPLKPSIKIKDGSYILKNEKDYTIVYSDNINIGIAKIMLKGKGNYTGRVIRYFQITANGQKSTLSGKCGKNAYWILIDDTLCIYGNGITYDYRDVSPWYEYRTRIKKVVISAGITGIGGASFWNCQNLTSVFLASTVTELGTCAFADCICLKSITFSAKTKIIGAEAFQGYTNLKEITLPASVSAIRFFAFEGCKKLKKITFKGNAPTIEQYALGNTSLSIFYPSKASGWVKAKQNPCGGKIIWKSY